MSISHSLPHWMYCERHDDVFRDFRMHVDCPVRFATEKEIEDR